MNDSTIAAPNLLSLTAPKRREPVPDAPERGEFAEQLDAVSPQDASQRPEKASAAEGDEEAPAPQAEMPAADETNAPPPTGEAPTDEPSSEDELLVVSIAVETLVLETPPDVQLPEEASTTIDVSLESSLEAAPVSADVVGGAVATDAAAAVGNVLPALAPGEELVTTNEPQPEPVDLSPETDSLAEVVDATPPDLNAIETTEAVGATAAAVATRAEVPSATPASSTAQPTADASIAPVAIESDTDSSEQQEGDADSERPKPVEPLTLPAAKTISDVAETPVEPTTERAPLPTVGGANEARPGSASAATNQPAAEPTPTIDPTRFVSRVARAFDVAQERGGGPVEIRLSPPELGSMQLKIELKEGVMTASLDVETPAARNALLDNLPALRDRLEQQQIRIESFDVDVREDSGERGGDWQPSGDSSDERSDEQHEPAPSATAPSTAADEESDTPRISTIQFGDDAINLVA